ncbi:hypothetical protein EP7_004255 [Isosphaeraceae bacterium EP7]
MTNEEFEALPREERSRIVAEGLREQRFLTRAKLTAAFEAAEKQGVSIRSFEELLRVAKEIET